MAYNENLELHRDFLTEEEKIMSKELLDMKVDPMGDWPTETVPYLDRKFDYRESRGDFPPHPESVYGQWGTLAGDKPPAPIRDLGSLLAPPERTAQFNIPGIGSIPYETPGMETYLQEDKAAPGLLELIRSLGWISSKDEIF